MTDEEVEAGVLPVLMIAELLLAERLIDRDFLLMQAMNTAGSRAPDDPRARVARRFALGLERREGLLVSPTWREPPRAPAR